MHLTSGKPRQAVSIKLHYFADFDFEQTNGFHRRVKKKRSIAVAEIVVMFGLIFTPQT